MEDSLEKICSCNGGLRVGSSLKRSLKRRQVAPKSCKNCSGRCTIDELEPLKAETFSVALNAQKLNWNNILKGRRSRKSIARSFNNVAKLGSSPERDADSSGCDSVKFVQPLMEQMTSGKSEHIPIKKRRQLLPAPQPSVATSHQNSLSAQTQSSLRHNEKKYHLRCRNRSAGPASKRSLKSRGIDGSGDKSRKGCGNGAFTGQLEGEYLNHDDFSGIQLLAAAAIMEDDAGNPTKEDHVVEDSPNSKSSNATCLATLCKVGSKSNDSRNSSSIASLHKDHNKEFPLLDVCADTSQGPHGCLKDGTTPDSVPSREDRRLWDLNVLMDAWDDPHNGSAAGSKSNGAFDFHMHLEGKQESSEDPLVPDPGGTEIEPKLDVEELPLKLTSESYFTSAEETADQAVDIVDYANSKQVMETDEILDSSLHFSSSMSTSEREKKTFSCNVAKALDEDTPSLHSNSSSILIAENSKESIFGSMDVVRNEYFSRSRNVYDEIKASGVVQVHSKTEEVTRHYLPVTEMSASVAQEQDAKNYGRSSELGGHMLSLRDTINNSVTHNREYVYNPKSNSDEMSCFSSSSNSGKVDSSGQHSVVAADGKSQYVTCTTADCKGHLKLDELVAKHELTDLFNEGSQMIKVEDSCNSYISRSKIGISNMSPEQVDSAIDARADSSYEDGELRGSCEETECVDSEFDVRNRDGSEIVDGVSNCSERRSCTRREGNEIKNRRVKCFTRKLMEDDRKKELNRGITEEIIQRRHLADRKYPTSMGGYNTSRMAWGKFQSHIEEGLSLNGRDGFSDLRLVSCISRGICCSPDNSTGKYGNRTGRDYQGRWSERTSVPYHPVDDKFDFDNQSQNANYSSRGSHWRGSPVGWDGPFRGTQRPRNFARSSGTPRLPHYNNNNNNMRKW